MTTPDGSWLTALVDGVVGLMDLIGAPGAGIAIALENLFPPLPSEVIPVSYTHLTLPTIYSV